MASFFFSSQVKGFVQFTSFYIVLYYSFLQFTIT
jgi:hypothetical protein